MGNLIVYPGTHYSIAEILKKTGAKKSFWFDARKGQSTPDQKNLPSLAKKGIADGEPYVCHNAHRSTLIWFDLIWFDLI